MTGSLVIPPGVKAAGGRLRSLQERCKYGDRNIVESPCPLSMDPNPLDDPNVDSDHRNIVESLCPLSMVYRFPSWRYFPHVSYKRLRRRFAPAFPRYVQ